MQICKGNKVICTQLARIPIPPRKVDQEKWARRKTPKIPANSGRIAPSRRRSRKERDRNTEGRKGQEARQNFFLPFGIIIEFSPLDDHRMLVSCASGGKRCIQCSCEDSQFAPPENTTEQNDGIRFATMASKSRRKGC